MKKMNNGVVKCNVEVFIIPNNARLVNNMLMNVEQITQNFKDIAEKNQLSYDPNNDKLVQLWYVSKDDLATENLIDHGGKILNENGDKCWISLSTMMEFLPESFFKEKVEGDTINISFPATLYDKCEKTPIILDMTLSLQQKKYRYARFGAFENALKYVCQ